MESEQTLSLQDALRHMIKSSGKTAADVSREMGKTSGYMSVVLADGRTPRASLFVQIASACGYEVFLANERETLRIELNENEQSPVVIKPPKSSVIVVGHDTEAEEFYKMEREFYRSLKARRINMLRTHDIPLGAEITYYSPEYWQQIVDAGLVDDDAKVIFLDSDQPNDGEQDA